MICYNAVILSNRHFLRAFLQIMKSVKFPPQLTPADQNTWRHRDRGIIWSKKYVCRLRFIWNIKGVWRAEAVPLIKAKSILKENKLIASLVHLWKVWQRWHCVFIIHFFSTVCPSMQGVKKTTENFVLFPSLRLRDVKRVERGGHRKHAADGRGGKKNLILVQGWLGDVECGH